jgi:DNA (cytosine-5)-methyltransferase 1
MPADANLLSSVDLFCGSGGLTLGLANAGFRTVFAADSDPLACKTFELNLGPVVRCVDVASLHASEILDASGLARGDLSLVCGGPPCQGFSLQRRGAADDPRNSLVLRFVELATALGPKAILLENVPALLGARGRQYLRVVHQSLDEAGYTVRTSVIDAVNFGVPQHRLRAFVVAIREDLASSFVFPSPTHEASGWVTVREAFDGLPEPPDDYTPHPNFANHTRIKISATNIERISHVPAGGGRRDIPLHLQLPCHRNDNGHRHLDVYGRMCWDAPAPTITAMFDNFSRGRFAHPVQNRSITGREGARLQSFPDTFVFVGDKKSVARQIGNAVPPRVATCLGNALRECLVGQAPKLGSRQQVLLFPR